MSLTRHAAIRLGVKKYDVGPQCKHGHGTIRYASSGSCVACHGDRNAAIYAAKSKEDIVAYCASRRAANREHARQYRARRKAA